MKMNYKIQSEKNPNPENIKILHDGIMAHAKTQKNQKTLEFFHYFIRDEDHQIQGGCFGCTLYCALYIDTLWVSQHLRHQGYGTELVKMAEQFDIQHNCTFANLNIFDWEALDFYKKLGFEIEFMRDGYDNDSSFYFLRKQLPIG
jgi:GNAT superfamily N-acetyltransferase